MQPIKEMLINDIKIYIRKIIFINSCIEIYDNYIFCKSAFTEEVNIAVTFFEVTKMAMAHTIMIETAKLFEDDSDVKNIKKLINCCATNYRLLGNELVRREIVEHNGEQVVNKHIEKISVLDIARQFDLEYSGFDPILQNLETQRNKYFAHNDNSFFGNQDELRNTNPVNLADVRLLINFATKVCNTFMSILNDGHTWEPVYKRAGDILNLFAALQKYRNGVPNEQDIK